MMTKSIYMPTTTVETTSDHGTIRTICGTLSGVTIFGALDHKVYLTQSIYQETFPSMFNLS